MPPMQKQHSISRNAKGFQNIKSINWNRENTREGGLIELKEDN